MKTKVSIIGSGFSSLAASCYLAKAGFEVVVFEKNKSLGGRARRLSRDGFHFDMGPTWYWMPDVFEKFFNDFGMSTHDYYELNRLSPAYKVYFKNKESITIADHLETIIAAFEQEERGSGEKLRHFIAQAQKNYHIAINEMVYKPGDSVLELVSWETMIRVHQFFKTISQKVRSEFKSEKLQQILEFPVLFLGAKPSDTPLFYNFMNYADFGLGTWHPSKGMYTVVEAMVTLAQSLGVHFVCEAEVNRIVLEGKKAKGLEVNGEFIASDVVLSGADYHHTEQLLPQQFRMYDEKYWQSRVFAPSSLLFYVGFSQKISNVEHHTLFFDEPFEPHAVEIYDTPAWPKKPLYYASFPSKTDPFFAPEGKEAATFLIPVAPGLEDSPEIRAHYFEMLMNRLEQTTGQELKDSVLFYESFGIQDFVQDYHSYKGNAYGLANILFQTAFLRPKIKSKKVQNLFFTGQLTVPGPGVPPSLISGKIASEKIRKEIGL
ncbi:phytoene desaturase family protein [Flavobacterium sp. NRK F10]|uniref:phytoene desaturase family protein n=1 Tax=Flavobacterium sp. NRK F10 TaxID=2954931 RepID=UPI002090D770|nr:phytoene desaturase family protein [Flavobacterium sp. NRK F10]MCO6174155.1 phytoene desaturase family protein [Flavobacterium sp. NRK F10]